MNKDEFFDLLVIYSIILQIYNLKDNEKAEKDTEQRLLKIEQKLDLILEQI